MSDTQYEKINTAYQQLCTSYLAIDDFRAKLLGFLPLVTGGGIFFLFNSLTDEAKGFLGAIGAFGFVVTLGLFSYEIYGIRKCHALIKAGKQLEGDLRIGGQFHKRPREVAGVINEPFAAGIIYPAVLAAWIYSALVFTSPQAALAGAIVVFIVGFAGILFWNLKLKLEDEPNNSVIAYLKTQFARLLKHSTRLKPDEKPNSSAILVELLNVISPDLQIGLQDKKSMEELKDRMRQLARENRNLSQKDWQELSRLTERLIIQAHTNNQGEYARKENPVV